MNVVDDDVWVGLDDEDWLTLCKISEGADDFKFSYADWIIVKIELESQSLFLSIWIKSND